MKYLSVCSGIEAASVAWHPLGWQPLAFSEIEPFPRAVLAHHYPDVPCHGDFTKLRDMPFIVDADVLVGGTPCQAFSVAGLRKSLDDDRGNLSLEFVRLADAIDDLRTAGGRDPSIIVWENVPGVLSVKDNAFGCFLAGLAGDVTPYVPPRGKWTDAGVVDGPQRQVAWRLLDAQYFGLAQRRRRVFVVASARDGFDPAAVLLEFEGVRRHSPPRREAGKVAPTIPSRSTAGGGLGTDFDLDGGVVQQPYQVGNTLTARMYKEINTTLDEGRTPIICATGDVTHTLKAEDFDASEDGTGRGNPIVPVLSNDPAHAICANEAKTYTNEGNMFQLRNVDGQPVTYFIMPQNSGKDYKAREVEVAQPIMAGGPVSGNQGGDVVLQPKGDAAPCVAVQEVAGTLGAGDGNRGWRNDLDQGAFIPTNMAVRRLTPRECERLQGFPDDYTMIPWKKKPADQCPDGPRYKALGNSMAVPCMRWIGKRIAEALK